MIKENDDEVSLFMLLLLMMLVMFCGYGDQDKNEMEYD